MKVIRCLNCKGVFAETDMTVPGHCPFCVCGKTPMLEEKNSEQDWYQEDLRQLWVLFGDIPIGFADDNIEEPFMDWPVGTNRFDIWHWFDDRYDGGVYKLMVDLEELA